MAMVPAICDSCGVTWGAEGVISGTGATNIQITGNKVGPCPNCGGMGSIPDGVYDLQDDTLKVVRAAGTTPENLQSLIDLLEGLRDGEASSAEVIETVEREAPDLAPVVRKGLASSDPIKLIALLVAILSLYLQASAPAPPSADEVAKAIREKPLPTYSVSAPSERKSSGRHKRPPKAHGKAKQRKSRKRR
jgi:hypothetical protein